MPNYCYITIFVVQEKRSWFVRILTLDLLNSSTVTWYGVNTSIYVYGCELHLDQLLA